MKSYHNNCCIQFVDTKRASVLGWSVAYRMKYVPEKPLKGFIGLHFTCARSQSIYFLDVAGSRHGCIGKHVVSTDHREPARHQFSKPDVVCSELVYAGNCTMETGTLFLF